MSRCILANESRESCDVDTDNSLRQDYFKVSSNFNKTIVVKWSVPDSNHKFFLRAGKEIMGCGWCGHNDPEG